MVSPPRPLFKIEHCIGQPNNDTGGIIQHNSCKLLLENLVNVFFLQLSEKFNKSESLIYWLDFIFYFRKIC